MAELESAADSLRSAAKGAAQLVAEAEAERDSLAAVLVEVEAENAALRGYYEALRDALSVALRTLRSEGVPIDPTGP